MSAFSFLPGPSKMRMLKNLVSFWIFGLCNNYAYVVMLSAAADIISQSSNSSNHDSQRISNSSRLNCTSVGTGAILLADIIPSLTVKILAPFFIYYINFHVKVLGVILFALLSFLIVATSNTLTISLIGVVFASISSGLGETTFLCMSSYFHRNVVSSWSSGTGGAGVIGAISFAGLAKLVGSRNTLFIITIVPLTSLIFYIFVLIKPRDEAFSWKVPITPRTAEVKPLLNDSDDDSNTDISTKFPKRKSKIQLVIGLLPLMIPLALVYFFEYLINQSLFELIYFSNSTLSLTEQYRWYQVLYQVGVFISRSSVNVFHFRHIWVLALLQGVNVAIFLCQVTNPYIGSIWILFVIILYEGFLGGMAYVNTFYRIAQESKPDEKEYKMGVATISDGFGITLSGLLSVPLHSTLCANF